MQIVRYAVKLSDIGDLVSGRLAAASFCAKYASDFAERRSLLDTHKRGAIIPVRVDEDTDLELTRGGLAALCDLFVDGSVNSVQLAYIADALQLAERVTFPDEEVRGYLDLLTDPEINGQFTAARAREIIREMRRRT